jgi:hypothetical protein
MLEKCNGKGLYKLFGNFSIDYQMIKETDYKLFPGFKGHKNIKRNPEKQGSFLFLMLLD